MLYDTIDLIAQNITTDDYGREVATETSRTVLCHVYSITQTEFYAAANTEIQPDLRFNVFFADYEGEEIIEHKGERYAVYRTFRSGDYMELYAERKVGA